MKQRCCNLLLTTFILLFSAGWAHAGPDAVADNADPAQAQDTTTDELDYCTQIPEQDKFPEKMRSGVHEFSCRTVRWVDGLFGDSHDFDESALGGKFSVGTSWNEFDGIRGRLRFRVRSDLPNFSSRWDAFFGRVDEESYISDTEQLDESAFRRGNANDDDTEWLLGLGYKNRDRSGDGWDYSFGVRLRTPPRMYVKAQYQKSVVFDSSRDLRYRQTVFWRDGTGYGTTTSLDTAIQRGQMDILRWEMFATITEETEGTEWWLGHTWYHNLGNYRGVSLKTFVRGITDAEVALQEYGLELTWRRQVARDWLFFNFGPTLTWPRELLSQKRSASFGFSVLMEFEFGQQQN